MCTLERERSIGHLRIAFAAALNPKVQTMIGGRPSFRKSRDALPNPKLLRRTSASADLTREWPAWKPKCVISLHARYTASTGGGKPK